MSSSILVETGTDALLGEDSEHLLLEDFPTVAWGPATRWTRKPPPGTQLDPNHPLCPDYCWPFNSPQGTLRDHLCRRAPLDTPSSLSTVQAMTPGPSKYGLGLRHTGINDRTQITSSASEFDKIVPLDGNFTILLAFNHTGATGSTWGGDTATGAQNCYLLTKWTDNHSYFFYGGSQVDGGILTVGDDLWFGTVGPRGVEIWQNGILRNTLAASPTRTSGVGPMYFGPFTPNLSAVGDYQLCMTWRRQLTLAEIAALTANPWQVFQPRQRLMTTVMSAEPFEAPSLWTPFQRRRWTRKPDPGTQLDPNHPHCPDMCWPFLSPASTPQILTRNINPGTPTAPVGTPTWSQGGKYGLAMRHTANTDITRFNSTALQSDSIIPTGNGGFTVMIAYKKTDTTSRAALVWGVDGALGAANDAYCFVDHNGGFTGFFFAGTTLQIANAGLTFGDDLWLFTTGPRGMEVWQNGIMLTSNASNPSKTAALTSCINTGQCLVAWPAGQPNFSDLADMALIMTWRKQLTWAAIRDLYVNPWQVFQPMPSLFAGDAATVGAGPGTNRFPALFLAA